MTSAIVSGESIADRDSDHGSEHELSINNDSPPSKNSNKRSHDDSDKDEPETKSAREDLRQTRISDRESSKSPKLDHIAIHHPIGNDEIIQEDKDMEEPVAVKTPESQSPKDSDHEMKDRASPKKKRSRRDSEDDEDQDGEPASTTNGENSTNGSNGEIILPQKKRHRDTSQDSLEKKSMDTKISTTIIPLASNITNTELSEPPKTISSPSKDASSNAFAKSGFASLASASSPFATVGTSKPSVFGGNAAQTTSGFGALATQKENPPLSGFGSLASNQPMGFGSTTTSGFGGLSGGFGGGFGTGFSAGFGSGPKLTSFAAPVAKSNDADSTVKPAAKKEKAFGAPESSGDEGSEDDDSDAEAGGDEDDDQPPAEEKKRVKAPKAPILDGEEDEITLCSFRGKLFVMSDKGWKERGVGAVKINIPRSHGAKMLFEDGDDDEEAGLISLETQENEEGESEAKDVEAKRPTKRSYTARLIMRQESTHRVILNSIILKDQVFQEKSTNTAIGIIFTAFEDGKPTNMQFKMNPSNASEFLREIEEVKKLL